MASKLLFPPHLHLVRPVPRPDPGLGEARRHPRLQHDQARIGDHGAVVPHEPHLGDEEPRPPLLAHYIEHLPEAGVGADAPHQEDLLLLGVGEGPLRHLDEHGEGRLLEGGADVGEVVLLCGLGRRRREAGEGEVHTFDDVGEGYVLLRRLRQGLQFGAAGVGEAHLPRELVQGVSDGDVQGLAEYAVPSAPQGQNLAVSAADVKDDRVGGAGLPLAHLDVGDAVVDADQGDPETEREGPGRRRHRPQARPEPRPLGEGDGVDGDAVASGGVQDLADDRRHVPGVVLGRLPGVDPPLGRDVGGALLGDDLLLVDEGTAEVPCRPLQPQDDRPSIRSLIRTFSHLSTIPSASKSLPPSSSPNPEFRG